MIWHKIVLIISISFLLISCRKESDVNCDEKSIRGVGIILDKPYSIHSSCIMEVTYPDSLALLKGKRITYSNDNHHRSPYGYSYISFFFGIEAEESFTSKAKYHVILDDTLHFYIEDIKIKKDTAGMNGMGNWLIKCIVDSFTVNGTRVGSIYNSSLYAPMSLGKYQEKEYDIDIK